MTKARNAVLVPTGLLLMAGALLIVLLLRAQLGLAPSQIHQINWTGPGAAAAPVVQQNSNSEHASQQAITSIGSTKPLSPPQPATQQPGTQTVPAPGSGQCPTESGSGLPCKIP